MELQELAVDMLDDARIIPGDIVQYPGSGTTGKPMAAVTLRVPGSVNRAARRNAHANPRCEFEEMRSTARCIIAGRRTKRDFKQVARFNAH